MLATLEWGHERRGVWVEIVESSLRAVFLNEKSAVLGESVKNRGRAQMKPGFHGGATRRWMGPQGRALGRGLLSLLHLSLFFFFFNCQEVASKETQRPSRVKPARV